MSLTANVAPTLGSAPVSLQAGNYGAIDDRRFWGSVASEGVLSGGSYNVTTTGSGMGLSVAASTGDGAIVQGDSVTGQGKYFVPPSSGALTVTAATADATNPRNDLVVLEVKDDAHDASGLNLARVRIVTGTPNGSAAVGDGPGTNGAPALPSSCLLLATVCVQAGSSTIAANRIRDRRNWAGGVPTFETSLPATAANGQEIYYRADSTNGVIWHLRFRNQADGGSATYPWEAVAGPAIYAETTPSGTTTSNTYTRTLTSGSLPTLSIPLAGEYYVTLRAYGITIGAAVDGWLSFTQGALGTSTDANAIFHRSGGTYTPASSGAFIRRATLTAATAYVEVKSSSGNAFAPTNAATAPVTIMAQPIRVG